MDSAEPSVASTTVASTGSAEHSIIEDVLAFLPTDESVNQSDEKAGKVATEVELQQYGKAVEEDNRLLSKLGYKKTLFRGFNEFMNYSFTMTSIAVIASIAGASTTFLGGGAGVATWAWVIVSFFTICTGASMAEICSSYPTSGSVYYWSAQMAPEGYGPAIAYVDGWFNLLGNAAADAFYCYVFAQIVVAAAQVYWTEPNLTNGIVVNFEAWTTNQQVALGCCVAILWGAKNLIRIDGQGWFNNFGQIYQVISATTTCIVLLSVCSSYSTNYTVWESQENGINMPQNNAFYLAMIGLLTASFSFVGYEAGGHMGEETRNAAVAAPRGIMGAVISCGVLGFFYLLTLLYVAGFAWENYDYNQIIVNVYAAAFTSADGNTLNVAGTVGLLSLLIVDVFMAGFSSLTVTVRIFYAMVRDGAIPGSKFIRWVHPKFFIPVFVVLCTVIFDCSLVLWNLDPSQRGATAFNSVTSASTVAYQISYAIPIFLRLTYARKTFKRGPFHLGRWSDVIGWLACFWMSITSIIFVFPNLWTPGMQDAWVDGDGNIYYPPANLTTFEEESEWANRTCLALNCTYQPQPDISTGVVNAVSMNYTCVVVGGVMLLSLVYWWLPAPYGARHFYKGPPLKKEEDKPDKGVELQKTDGSKEESPSGVTVVTNGHKAAHAGETKPKEEEENEEDAEGGRKINIWGDEDKPDEGIFQHKKASDEDHDNDNDKDKEKEDEEEEHVKPEENDAVDGEGEGEGEKSD